MSLPTLPKVQKLQDTLHGKAKESPDFRFYSLYDKIYREDVLWVAYRRCLINKGAAGVDGQTFEEIEQYSVKTWLGELMEELRTKTYRPQPVQRVFIPKPDDPKQRRGTGLPPRGPDLAPPVEPLYAAVHPRLEDVGIPTTLGSENRQLR